MRRFVQPTRSLKYQITWNGGRRNWIPCPCTATPIEKFAKGVCLISSYFQWSAFCLQHNTFQAVLVGDKCQSYAIFNYPQNGLAFPGSIPAIVGAWTNKHILSGYRNVTSISQDNSRLIYRLTPECTWRRLQESNCRATVQFPASIMSGDDFVQCPRSSLHASVSFMLSAEMRLGQSCFRSSPQTFNSKVEVSSVRVCQQSVYFLLKIHTTR